MPTDTLATIERPCREACSHEECEERRAMAARRCPVCQAAIGYERCYVVVKKRMTHAVCAEGER